MSKLNWQCLTFHSLTPAQLYGLLQLRSAVFVVEQACIYQDLDDLDQDAMHLVGYLDEQLACYARLIPPGVKYDEPAIGRITSHPSLRRHGYGRAAVKKAIQICQDIWPAAGIRISAQQRLENFYREFSFRPVSAAYLEDGLPHVEMFRPGNE
ncbi:MAG: GNAT family N-acetyltransferase [Gammaproteobacteria bacterium]|nr:GNAT family N-acetyltransferase [Pseudomonadales bacterium]MCP5346457.1 GNAT family N-acetyltransferase [Pseudomonadales bacterium]